MPVEWAQSVVSAVGIYLAIGVAFAFVFLAFGLRRLDPIAADGPLRFKFLIAPGIVALWPLIFVMWLSGQERDA